MSGILAAIACGFLGMAVGAALQRWGEGAKRHTAWKDEPADWGSELDYVISRASPWSRQ